MSWESIAESPWLATLVIFLARVLDVSLGTLRTLLVFRGRRVAAALVATCEVFVWLMAASRVIGNLDAWYLALGYAFGFAAGNYVGMSLESRLALGTELVRIVSRQTAIDLPAKLRARGHAVVELCGQDDGVPVLVLLVVERRRAVPQLLLAVRELDALAVCTVTDVRDPSPRLARLARVQPQPSNWKRK